MPSFERMKQYHANNAGAIGNQTRQIADFVINDTFTNDAAYKRVRVLTSDGWIWCDAKYQKHTTPSILKDEVDYYLQFRPKTHFKLGTYVIVPDDTSPKTNTDDLEDPFDQDYADRTQWWLIVGRTDANQFVRYSILKCNYDFKWVYNGEVCHCYGCVRNANSYTSGEYQNDMTLTLDNINSAWLPDTLFTYGKNYESLGLDDIQSIDLGMRFMISDNTIHPKTYEVSKVTELVPAGIIKLTMKQKPFDAKRDNIPLQICDYYDENGDSLVNPPTPTPPDPSDPSAPTSTIHRCVMNDDGELEYADDIPDFNKNLRLNKVSYFLADFSDEYSGQYIWKVRVKDNYKDENDEYIDKYTDEQEDKLEDYIQIVNFEDGSCSLKPSRVKDLLGVSFVLSVSDENGGHYSEYPPTDDESMEVIA